jgi:hypothetical protein
MVEGLLAANARWLLGQWPACHLSTAAATPSTTSAMEKLGPHARCRDRRLVGRLVIKAPTCIEHAEHIGPHWTPLDSLGHLEKPVFNLLQCSYPIKCLCLEGFLSNVLVAGANNSFSFLFVFAVWWCFKSHNDNVCVACVLIK